MPRTINSYVPDQGEVSVTLSAGNITSLGAGYTTAETIIFDGVVRSFKRTNDPQRALVETLVTGDPEPILTEGRTLPRQEWELIIVDDYHEGLAGEWGTDLIKAGKLFFDLNRLRINPAGIKSTPAGGTTGDIQTSLTAPIWIRSVGEPEIDADSNGKLAIMKIMIACTGSTKAAHA